MLRVAERAKKVVPRSVKRILKRHIPFRPYIMRKNVEGLAFDFLVGDYDGRQWYDLNSTDPVWVEMGFLRDHVITAGDVVIECGAHHGCTTVMLSKWVGDQGRILAFEPQQSNCDIIERNIALNKLRNVVLERKAVGAKRGEAAIDGASNSSITLSGEGQVVGLVPLDDYAHLNPTLLKIDVEGFEFEVLSGACKILATRPKIALEVHPEVFYRYNTSTEKVLSLLALDRYKSWVQWQDGEEPVPYDPRTPITKRVHLFCLPT